MSVQLSITDTASMIAATREWARRTSTGEPDALVLPSDMTGEKLLALARVAKVELKQDLPPLFMKTLRHSMSGTTASTMLANVYRALDTLDEILIVRMAEEATALAPV
jgi:hypothetical protein